MIPPPELRLTHDGRGDVRRHLNQKVEIGFSAIGEAQRLTLRVSLDNLVTWVVGDVPLLDELPDSRRDNRAHYSHWSRLRGIDGDRDTIAQLSFAQVVVQERGRLIGGGRALEGCSGNELVQRHNYSDAVVEKIDAGIGELLHRA